MDVHLLLAHRPRVAFLQYCQVLRGFFIIVYPIILAVPVSDEVIGRIQFHYLCETQANIALSSDWTSVKRARRNDEPIVALSGYAIRIMAQRESLVDLDTGKEFLKINAFHAKGGILFDKAGLGLGTTTSCWPPGWGQVLRNINADNLIKKGEFK